MSEKANNFYVYGLKLDGVLSWTTLFIHIKEVMKSLSPGRVTLVMQCSPFTLESLESPVTF